MCDRVSGCLGIRYEPPGGLGGQDARFNQPTMQLAKLSPKPEKSLPLPRMYSVVYSVHHWAREEGDCKANRRYLM